MISFNNISNNIPTGIYLNDKINNVFSIIPAKGDLFENSIFGFHREEIPKKERTVKDITENKIIVQNEDREEEFNKKQLCTHLSKLITPETNLNFTLNEFLQSICCTGFIEQTNSLTQSIAFDRIKKFLQGDLEYTTQFFKKCWKDFLKDSKNPITIMLPIIVHVGQKWLDRPLNEILSMVPTPETQKGWALRAMKWNLCNLNAEFNSTAVILNCFVDHLIFLDKKKYTSIRNNLRTNIKIINDTIKPILEQHISQCKESENLMDDYLFLKIKNHMNVYHETMIKIRKMSLTLYKTCLDKLKDEKVRENFKNSITLNDNFDKDMGQAKETFNTLFETYGTHLSDNEMYQNIVYFIFGDELESNAKTLQYKQKKIKKQNHDIQVKDQIIDVKSKKTKKQNKINTSTVPLINFEIEPQKPLHEQILSQHSWLIYDLSNKIKLKCKEADLSNKDFKRAKTHSKEILDHLSYASQNFELFCKAFLKHDFYALNAIIPFLFLDQHLVIEQLLKRRIALSGKEPFPSHNLADLYGYSSCKANPDLEPFINDFSDAMLQSRYPLSWKAKLQQEKVSEPLPLQWILYIQQGCQMNAGKNIQIHSDQLIELCTFVFDSYQKTLRCVFEQLDLDPELQTSFSQMTGNFKNLKENLLKGIESANKATWIKNKKTDSKNSILNSLKKLTEISEKVLANNKNASAKLLFEEASNHLIRIDSINYLQQHYNGVQFEALYHRNLLMFQWLYELIYRFHGHIAGLGELRWVCNHNLESFHAFSFLKEATPKELKEFNLSRNLHYTHEKGDSQQLQMVQELLKTMKILKKLDPSDPDWFLPKNQKKASINIETIEEDKKTMKENRVRILEKGITLLEKLIKMISNENEI